MRRETRRSVTLGGIALLLIATNVAYPVLNSSRIDMQGNPSTSVAYLGLVLAVVFGAIWFVLVKYLGFPGGMFSVALGLPAFLVVMWIVAQGVLPDLDYGLYVHVMVAILAGSCLVATLVAESFVPRRAKPARATQAA